MAYGAPSAASKVRLNYHAIDTALHDKKKRGRGYTDHVMVGSNAIVERVGDGEVALKLHSTHIITFRSDGSKVLNADGWEAAPLTQHWWYQARVYMRNDTPNRWSAKQVFYYHDGAYPTLFYDGMVIDRDGALLSEPRFGVKSSPSAEAKAFRKKLTKIRAEYMPHLRMWDTVGKPTLVGAYHPHNSQTEREMFAVFCEGDFVEDVAQYAWQVSSGKSFVKTLDAWLATQYRRTVLSNGWLDGTPYLPTK